MRIFLRTFIFIIVLSFTIYLLACKNPASSDCDRTGAVCKDGTTTTATGSGACSSHGGVDHWLCK
jgi:hypothetical protein